MMKSTCVPSADMACVLTGVCSFKCSFARRTHKYFCYCCRTPHWATEQPFTEHDRKLGQNTAAMTKEVRDFTRAREAQKALCPMRYPLTQERQDQLRLAEEWPELPPWIVRLSNMYCCFDQEGHHNLCGLDRKPLTKEQYERRQAQKARK